MVFELLSNECRRYALYYLKEQNRPVAVDELADVVAEWDDSVSTVQSETHVQLELQHTHLPKATEAEFIEYKPDAGLVEVQGLPPTFNVITAVARVIEQPADE
ncbi:hypothetical protein OB955_25295 [Halobacteria archaeon AArc-m2/3/4]|uniref:DUF7344 domain-containing protein n=1 Tax=Natronoglomus mannanivorans TaxID=2979990 RepID=A0ABT2QM27_9EURY|nr:hypothetical protein [Halobacteria archaeon AArc-m2/3/4]